MVFSAALPQGKAHTLYSILHMSAPESNSAQLPYNSAEHVSISMPEAEQLCAHMATLYD